MKYFTNTGESHVCFPHPIGIATCVKCKIQERRNSNNYSVCEVPAIDKYIKQVSYVSFKKV